MTRRKKILGLATSLIMVMSLLLIGCGGGTDGSQPADSGTDSSGAAETGFTTVTPGALTVGSDCDYPPFIEMDGEQPVGYEYDLLEAVAEEMGLELVYLAPQNFDTILASVAAGTKMDLGCSSITINDERRQLVDFSLPYFDSNQSVVALEDSGHSSAMDFNGLTVGAQSGTTGADWVRENLVDSGTVLKEYNQASEMMAALVAGDIQGAFYDEPAAMQWVTTLYTNTRIVESIPTGEQYGFAISKDNPELLAAVNEALLVLKDNGTFDEIFLRYFPDLTPPVVVTAN